LLKLSSLLFLSLDSVDSAWFFLYNYFYKLIFLCFLILVIVLKF
jgi:hypothetical protein